MPSPNLGDYFQQETRSIAGKRFDFNRSDFQALWLNREPFVM
jgi:hypothetical protein